MIGRRGEVERMGDKIMFCQRDVFISHFNGACDVVIVRTKLKPHANQKKMYEMFSYCKCNSCQSYNTLVVEVLLQFLAVTSYTDHPTHPPAWTTSKVSLKLQNY